MHSIAILCLLSSLLAAAPPLPNATAEALALALADERQTEAFYAAVMAKFGERRPFSNIIEAERRHQQALLSLFEAHGLAIPAPTPLKVPTVPSTFKAAAEASAQAEMDNVALYDRLLKTVQEPDVKDVFHRLQWASQERHLPAFRRHAK